MKKKLRNYSQKLKFIQNLPEFEPTIFTFPAHLANYFTN